MVGPARHERDRLERAKQAAGYVRGRVKRGARVRAGYAGEPAAPQCHRLAGVVACPGAPPPQQVPFRIAVGGHEQQPAGPEDARELRDPAVGERLCHVGQDRKRVHEVEAVVGVRTRRLE